MSNIEKDKTKQINDIVAIVKLVSLLFTGMIFIQYAFKNDADIINKLIYSESIVLGFSFLIMLLLSIYILWTLSIKNKMNEKSTMIVNFIERKIFIIVFTITIIISGGNTSQYKVLFLFIIITTTIQSGMKEGLLVAAISSFIILGMDIIYMPDSQVNVYFENDLVLSGIFVLTALPLGFYVKIEGEHIKRLLSLANEDGLTGVYNHRYFYDSLSDKIKEADDTKTKLSMLFIDIDYFKQYNDTYGHQAGDKVLRDMGAILKKSTREKDIVTRYGGEEFAIILPSTDENEASIIAEKIRDEVESTYFEGQENQPNKNLTVSIGISIYPDKARDSIDLIKSADDALYRAKFFNKNRVETYVSIFDELNKDITDEDVEVIASIKTLISVINAKDRYTYGHGERLVFYCKLLAEKLRLSKRDKMQLLRGAYVHDIGKINISKEILVKKMPLTNEEWNTLKEHPQNGVDILKPMKALNNLQELVLYHHEKYDGTGYPSGLKGSEIPYLARILTVVDSFDAMTSNRPYNRRKSYEEAIKELRRCSGTQFDPDIAESFIEVIKENKDNLGNLA